LKKVKQINNIETLSILLKTNRSHDIGQLLQLVHFLQLFFIHTFQSVSDILLLRFLDVLEFLIVGILLL